MHVEVLALEGNLPAISNLSPEVRERAHAVRARLDAIRRQSPPPDEQLPEVTHEQLERIRAFGLREDR